jgi:hypothetical protein
MPEAPVVHPLVQYPLGLQGRLKLLGAGKSSLMIRIIFVTIAVWTPLCQNCDPAVAIAQNQWIRRVKLQTGLCQEGVGQDIHSVGGRFRRLHPANCTPNIVLSMDVRVEAQIAHNAHHHGVSGNDSQTASEPVIATRVLVDQSNEILETVPSQS